ncbi:hypothetical protein IQ255_27835 [Pleurocapsales cyanobacterium LEGE 10410]|nr:hypothetical protein [Pleurocapsales cyanobacterium LEGE 10410]
MQSAVIIAIATRRIDRQGWTQDAISYNSLVASWSEISRLAAMEQQLETAVQGELVV